MRRCPDRGDAGDRLAGGSRVVDVHLRHARKETAENLNQRRALLDRAATCVSKWPWASCEALTIRASTSGGRCARRGSPACSSQSACVSTYRPAVAGVQRRLHAAGVAGDPRVAGVHQHADEEECRVLQAPRGQVGPVAEVFLCRRHGLAAASPREVSRFAPVRIRETVAVEQPAFPGHMAKRNRDFPSLPNLAID